ncbi:reverse transcriptase domain-containing protein [Clostridium sp.]|uniref:reverse transcriptase domain-containing protein n=1 Tax=Clostridium sp. TaxID=1506 RepID=UPI0028411ED1|nr:reverse transcriptase domain-containing protein [Clostridium sp.]MDR3594960.1 reverse transcriptase domain-containing protein [Clostridium sp.]
MIENQDNTKNKRQDYREQVNELGKKEFTLIKMQEYGFWPKNLPTPYERQENETKEEYAERKALIKDYEKIIKDISDLYDEKDKINQKLRELKKKYDETWDYEKIRLDVAKTIMEESIARRKEIKEKRALEKIQKTEAWQKEKADRIVFIGKGYSGLLFDKENNEDKLSAQGLPIIKDDKALAEFLEIEYKKLRFLVYHRDVVSVDHYHRYSIPKKKGGERNIAAPKSVLKNAQRKILEGILSKVPVSDYAHGFLHGKSVVSGAKAHMADKPYGENTALLINMDLEDFFPTITFERVRGMFKAFGYSGYISSLLAMICTYCERMQIEVRGEIKYVKTSDRILPQGSPASPMITNIICVKLDKRLSGLASKYNCIYTRYADDMSFSFIEESKDLNLGRFMGLVSKIVSEEGLNINQKKTRFLRKNNRQCITGIVINNDEIGVPKKWIKTLRAAIYNANKLKNNGEEVPAKTVNEISGMVSWVKSVNSKRYADIIEVGMNLIKD